MSAAASASARSAAFTLSVTGNAPGSVSTLLSGSGSVDLSRQVGQMTVSVPSLAALTGGADDSVTVVSDRSSVYVHVPSLTALTGGKSWFELPAGSRHQGFAVGRVTAAPRPVRSFGPARCPPVGRPDR